jgi:surface polysaccharide O-acyltransferase-like enzyme
MLIFYQRWAKRLYPLRWLFILLFLSALAGFGWLIFAATVQQSQRWQLTSVVLALTSLLLWFWASIFQRSLPPLDAVTGLRAKLKLRLYHLWYYFLACLITVLLLATTYLGLRVLKGIIATLFFS